VIARIYCVAGVKGKIKKRNICFLQNYLGAINDYRNIKKTVNILLKFSELYFIIFAA
jgi:hypothetical protein